MIRRSTTTWAPPSASRCSAASDCSTAARPASGCRNQCSDIGDPANRIPFTADPNGQPTDLGSPATYRVHRARQADASRLPARAVHDDAG